MKIIDLLNKIANGEQPKHIRVYNEDWYWNDYDGYVTKWSLSTTPDAQHYLFGQYRLDFALNKDVEIIEEKEIPERVPNAEVFEVPKLNNMELSNIALTNKEDIRVIKETLNQVLDYLKSKGE